MQEAPSVDAFQRDPIGRYVLERCFLCWSFDPTLWGCIYWGTLTGAGGEGWTWSRALTPSLGSYNAVARVRYTMARVRNRLCATLLPHANQDRSDSTLTVAAHSSCRKRAIE